MKVKILSVGEIIWDVYPEKKVIGGAPLNFAAHAVICGAESVLVSAVGEDALGEEALGALHSFGVDCRYIKKNKHKTGQCIVTLDEQAVPCYHVLTDVAYDNIVLSKSDIDEIVNQSYDALYFGTLIQRNACSAEALRTIVAHHAFRIVFCDVNLRPNCYDRDSVAFCLKNATVLKISAEEEPLLREFGMYAPKDESLKAVAESLCKAYPQLEIVLITLGKEGSYAYEAKTDKDYFQAAVGERVVSTVGAGDSYSAAFLTSYLSGKSITDCMKKAAEISGFVVAHTEAVPVY